MDEDTRNLLKRILDMHISCLGAYRAERQNWIAERSDDDAKDLSALDSSLRMDYRDFRHALAELAAGIEVDPRERGAAHTFVMNYPEGFR